MRPVRIDRRAVEGEFHDVASFDELRRAACGHIGARDHPDEVWSMTVRMTTLT